MGDLNSIPYLDIINGNFSSYETDLQSILKNDMSLNDISSNIININKAFSGYLEQRSNIDPEDKTALDSQLLAAYNSNMNALNTIYKQKYEKYNKVRNILTSLKNEKGYLDIQKKILLGNQKTDSYDLGEIEITKNKIQNMEDKLMNSNRMIEIKEYYEKKAKKQNSVIKNSIIILSLLLLISLIYNTGFLNEQIYLSIVGCLIAFMVIYIVLEVINISMRDNYNFDEYYYSVSPNSGLSDVQKGIVKTEKENDNTGTNNKLCKKEAES